MTDITPAENNETEDTECPAFELNSVLVEGKYSPTGDELIDILEKIDLVEVFSETKLVSGPGDIFTLSFDSIDKSHLFVLCVGAEGAKHKTFYYSSPGTFFDGNLLDAHRVDGAGVLSFTETLDDGRSNLSIVLRQGDDVYRETLTDLVKEVISTTMPHLSDQIQDISLE